MENKTQKRKFGLGAYFDLYSASESDWNTEKEYNQLINAECLEVMLEYPTGNENFHDEKIDSLKNSLSKFHIATHAPTINISLVSLNSKILEASIEEHIKAIDVSQKLGSSLMTIHGGEYPYYSKLNGAEPTKTFNSSLARLIPYAADKGVTIQVENLKNKFIFPQTIDEIDRILEANEGLALALDLRHCCLTGINPLEALKRYRERISSIQYRVDCGMTDDELLEFFRELKDSDFTGYFIVEDSALNVADKNSKPMIESGIEKMNNCMSVLELEKMGNIRYRNKTLTNKA